MAPQCPASEAKSLANEAEGLVSSPQYIAVAAESLDVACRDVHVDARRAGGPASEIEAEQQRVVVGAAVGHGRVAVGVALRILLVGIDVPLRRATQLLRQ